MLKNFKIPFIIAPLIFIIKWGFFIYQSNFNLTSAVITVFITLSAFLLYFLEKNYPVISENFANSMFVYISVITPLSSSVYEAIILPVFIIIYLLFVKSSESLKLISYSGVIAGISLLFTPNLGIFISIIPILFTVFFTPQKTKTRFMVIYIMSASSIVILAAILRFLYDYKIHTLFLPQLYNNKIFIFFFLFSIITALFSNRSYFKFKIRKRKHILINNLLIFILIVFIYVYKISIFYGIISSLWALLVYFAEKDKRKTLALRSTAILAGVLLYFLI